MGALLLGLQRRQLVPLFAGYLAGSTGRALGDVDQHHFFFHLTFFLSFPRSPGRL
jgi:hypothetical protein